tara:strand:- start:474 stop:1358 length:885 start_codon:yes stop_codon:yes gene_type:complete
MGNNKKTVRCSFCNKLGHNRVSCERLKESIELNREDYGSSHPDVKKYDNYMKLYSEKSKINAQGKRFCKYCRQPNHNVRTCPKRQQDISKLKKRNNSWRELILNLLKEKGVGLGCILTNEQSAFFGSRSENRGDKWILTTIYWEKISWLTTRDKYTFSESLDTSALYHRTQSKVFKLVNLNNSSVSTVLSVSQMLENPLIEESKRMDYTWEVISRIDELLPPDEWLTVNDKVFDLLCVNLFNSVCNNKGLYEALSWNILKNKPLYLIANSLGKGISSEILESIIKEKKDKNNEE